MTMEPLSRVLFSLYKNEPQHGAWIISCMQQAWPNLVGSSLSQCCRPVSFRNGVLAIEAVDAIWHAAIKSLEQEILEKLRAKTGVGIQKIEVL